MPRSTRKHSKGDITPPAAFWTSRKRSLCSGFEPISAPPRPSEWPLRYFVVECITMSAPSASGLCSTGDRKVLSTLTSTPLRVGDLRHAGNVGEHHQRIARRLDVHELRVRLHRRFDGGQVAGVDVLDLDAVAAHDLVEEADGAGIHVARADDVVAGAQHGHQRRDGRHAGGEGVAAGAAFERGQRRLQPVARGVAGARVVPAAVAADAGEFKGRGKVNGHIHRARQRVRVLPGMDGKGRVFVVGTWVSS